MTGNEMLMAVAILAAIFGPLSLIAYAVKKTVLAIRRRRARREAARRIIQAPLLPFEKRTGPRPVPPRVLYAPIAEKVREIRRETAENEAEVVIPFVLSPSIFTDLSTQEAPFRGKGGESGGAGAQGTWDEEPKPVEVVRDDLQPVAEPTVLETSETTIDEPDAPAAETES